VKVQKNGAHSFLFHKKRTKTLSFLSFYKETKPKKIVVARSARCSRLFASAAAFEARLTTFRLLIYALRETKLTEKVKSFGTSKRIQ